MKDELFSDLVESVREGGSILKGKVTPSRSFQVEAPKVREIREAYDLSQAEFAALLGISVDTLQNWEQGRRTPAGPAKILLQIVAKHPEAVWDVVRPRPGDRAEPNSAPATSSCHGRSKYRRLERSWDFPRTSSRG